MPTNKTPASSGRVPITATRHADKRANIPTEELRDFVVDEEKAPKSMLYPRDPSLDPQLVWKGKDEQDRHPLEVPAVPVYIQEKISPQAIIENVRAQAKLAQPEQQLNLFNDFNNISFEDLVDFYHHEQNWTNRMILGDSLLVMTSLAEKEALKGRVQMIYMDPPYGIKFGSNWQVSTRKRDVKDGKEEDLTRQPEQIKAFRDTWELGVHSYLAYLRDRLTVARELLTESGSLFVQISDQNVHLVRIVLDEVFGSENQCATIIWKKGTPDSATIRNAFNYLLWYVKDLDYGSLKVRKVFLERSGDEGTTEDPRKLALWGCFPEGERPLTTDEKRSILLTRDKAQVFRVDKVIELGIDTERQGELIFNGETYYPGSGKVWRGKPPQMERLKKAERIINTKEGFGYRFFIDDFPKVELTNLWEDTAGNIKDMRYVVETNPKIIERCILMTTDPGDLVLDPTCGGGTTAYVAEQWGRRWITIDTSRVAIALARTRLMAGRYPYYVLSDSPEGIQKEAELNKQLPPSPLPPTTLDVRRGFVYKRVPHITLKSIANNEAIDEIHARYQGELEVLRVRRNELTGQGWEEWQMPREMPLTPALSQGERGQDLSPAIFQREKAVELLAEWWGLRRQRQKEIDDSIASRADTELLYDQPYEENRKVRVSGPFTVESLSPHRVLSMDEERPASEVEGQNLSAAAVGFETLILDNLRAAGVQNTKQGERLKFTRLEPFAGTWLQAVGEYEEKETTAQPVSQPSAQTASQPSPQPSPTGRGGKMRRVAVCIGPEHGTVGAELVKDAAKEAVQGVGFDLLVVLGFAFDPHVSEEVKRYGKLTVLPARINPDLQMGDLLLKKSGAGNLFTVFGEPDLEVKPQVDGKLVVTIKGVDIYDPTTGEIRSSSTDDIACWFVDTDYNGESFFVRQAYFTGADEPYDKLKRALRAEVDEAAWSALYATTSYPFGKPKSGKIAVKVINHYGDEVMRVYKIG